MHAIEEELQELAESGLTLSGISNKLVERELIPKHSDVMFEHQQFGHERATVIIQLGHDTFNVQHTGL